MACPDAETLARYAEAKLDATESDGVRAHVDGCAACRELLITLVRSSQPTAEATDTPWDVPLPGAKLGRYRVVNTRGAGAMGVVLAAHDPQLDRPVALKLLRPDLFSSNGAQAPLRLLLEAQLMARVRHPNVVTVYDVIVEGQQVFIAMELVEGQTLRDWLEARPRTPDEVLEVFRAAGRGLAAAHEAGVVHRDFKPDNVLVDGRGQVLVSDFGLAWSRTAGASPSSAQPIGTPAYMAPEQQRGEPVDARADQFAFCVALFEALEGERPSAPAPAPLRRARVHPRVGRALARGLSVDPAARFPSMGALLAELEPPRRGWRPWAALAVTALLLLAAGWWARRRADCEPTLERLSTAWSAPRRAALVTRIGSEELATRVDEVLRALEPAWAQVCAESGDAAARQRMCLESRVQGLEVTAEVLSLATTDLRASTALVSRLEGPEGCLAGEVLTLVPAPSDQREAIGAARVQALTADALRHAGQLEAAQDTALQAVEAAQRTGWRPVEAEARLAAAQVFRARGQFAEAEKHLGDALLAAEAGRHFEAIARIAVQHILVVGTQTVRPDDAEPWVKRAEAALEQLPRPRLRAEVDVALTMLRVAQGRRAEALQVSDRALAWTNAHDPVATADLHALRALLFLQFGAYALAYPEAELAARARTERLGAEHPLTLHAVVTLGEAQARTGRWVDAVSTLTPTIAVLRARRDVSPLTMATALVGLGVALGGLQRHDEALAATAEARELVQARVGLTHRYAALAERAWGLRLLDAGRVEEGVAALQRAVEVGAATVGETHIETLESRGELALGLVRSGDVARGITEARAVVAAVTNEKAPLVPAMRALALAPEAASDAAQRADALEREVRGVR